MPTLILSRTCQPEANRLAEIARAEQWRCEWVEPKSTPDSIDGGNLGFYGESDVGLRVAAHNRLALIEPSLDLLTRLPRKYTLRDISFMSLEDAFQLPHRSFVKPADCTNKAFEAGVCEAGKYLRCSSKVPRNTPVLVSEPVSWEVEYRVIVLERAVVTFSPYILAGRLARDKDDRWPYCEDEATEAISLCNQLLADESIAIPPVFTLDVGIIENRGWAIVEFNPVWCSGLLGCDLSKMLSVLRRACWRKEELSTADAQWVIERRQIVK